MIKLQAMSMIVQKILKYLAANFTALACNFEFGGVK